MELKDHMLARLRSKAARVPSHQCGDRVRYRQRNELYQTETEWFNPIHIVTSIVESSVMLRIQCAQNEDMQQRRICQRSELRIACRNNGGSITVRKVVFKHGYAGFDSTHSKQEVYYAHAFECHAFTLALSFSIPLPRER
ncbi:hypothetical protein EVAR_89532_1 [Eumeta japonica]|uniref:Uncharacterized protein n=1 Tax=Eumeta variegata TaxID=151549 RepID=A0A4C1Y9Q3_EUMVA|nr:hypothetical protein EVAR_89532_1 [Eumeta japonica]